MEDYKQLRDDIAQIKSRNLRVESDKAWENSWTRKLIIIALTYAVVVSFFFTAGLPNPWINAVIPAGAFILSTLTLPLAKSYWLKKRQNP